MNERAKRILEKSHELLAQRLPPRGDDEVVRDAMARSAQRRAADPAPVTKAADDATDAERAGHRSWEKWLNDRLDYERNVILEAVGQGVKELFDEEASKWRKERDDLRSQISKLEVEIARSAVEVAHLRQAQCELACDKGVDLPAWPKREKMKAVN
jgi:hypothetical protein